MRKLEDPGEKENKHWRKILGKDEGHEMACTCVQINLNKQRSLTFTKMRDNKVWIGIMKCACVCVCVYMLGEGQKKVMPHAECINCDESSFSGWTNHQRIPCPIRQITQTEEDLYQHRMHVSFHSSPQPVDFVQCTYCTPVSMTALFYF